MVLGQLLVNGEIAKQITHGIEWPALFVAA
jgi:hypothetical protein